MKTACSPTLEGSSSFAVFNQTVVLEYIPLLGNIPTWQKTLWKGLGTHLFSVLNLEFWLMIIPNDMDKIITLHIQAGYLLISWLTTQFWCLPCRCERMQIEFSKRNGSRSHDSHSRRNWAHELKYISIRLCWLKLAPSWFRRNVDFAFKKLRMANVG